MLACGCRCRRLERQPGCGDDVAADQTRCQPRGQRATVIDDRLQRGWLHEHAARYVGIVQPDSCRHGVDCGQRVGQPAELFDIGCGCRHGAVVGHGGLVDLTHQQPDRHLAAWRLAAQHVHERGGLGDLAPVHDQPNLDRVHTRTLELQWFRGFGDCRSDVAQGRADHRCGRRGRTGGAGRGAGRRAARNLRVARRIVAADGCDCIGGHCQGQRVGGRPSDVRVGVGRVQRYLELVVDAAQFVADATAIVLVVTLQIALHGQKESLAGDHAGKTGDGQHGLVAQLGAVHAVRQGHRDLEVAVGRQVERLRCDRQFVAGRSGDRRTRR